MDAKKESPVSEECFAHGKKLRVARIAAGKTLCDVADGAAMTLEAASMIERGLIDNLHITPEDWAK
jgi:transcriptional regulator with XRE-family HTH domain